jgi:hypothetical protein
MVEKYQRERMAIPCRMVAELVQGLRTEDLRAAKAARRLAARPARPAPAESGAASPEPGSSSRGAMPSDEPAADHVGDDLDLDLRVDAILNEFNADHDLEGLERVPDGEPATSSEEEDEQGDLSFWILKSAADAGGAGACHHVNFSFEPNRFACKRVPHDPDAAICVGSRPPPKARICKQCLGHRPDVAALVGSWGVSLT